MPKLAYCRWRRGEYHKRSRRLQNEGVVTEGHRAGTVATQSGWSPDYTIEGNYQTLTHLTLNPTEEHISQTCNGILRRAGGSREGVGATWLSNMEW